MSLISVNNPLNKGTLPLYLTVITLTISYPVHQQILPIISSVQSLSHVRLFVTPWITAHQASLSITNSQSLLKLMSIKSVMPSSHLILCHPLLLLPPIPPSIRPYCSSNSTGTFLPHGLYACCFLCLKISFPRYLWWLHKHLYILTKISPHKWHLPWSLD